MTYEDQLNLAQSHLLHCRVQAQAAMRLLSTPPEDVRLDEMDWARMAIVSSIGARASEVIEDINAQLAAGKDVLNILEID